VPSLRARVTPGAFPLQRLLVVLVAGTWLSPIGAAAQTTNRAGTTGPTFSRPASAKALAPGRGDGNVETAGRYPTMALTADIIAGHPALHGAIRQQSRLLLEAYEANPRLASVSPPSSAG
jgi:hypothetical protein